MRASFVSMSYKSSADAINCASVVTRLVFTGTFSNFTTLGALFPCADTTVDAGVDAVDGDPTGVADREGSAEDAFDIVNWMSFP